MDSPLAWAPDGFKIWDRGPKKKNYMFIIIFRTNEQILINLLRIILFYEDRDPKLFINYKACIPQGALGLGPQG